ncbi:high-potential iron-sulfur protein [Herbaspirillum sp. RTI4]|uniref:high-potential iron-sulfur protein n=1 Tax=Herbaspirillum sp. RTI4 TaxID=3048640 RepID=UPI002AB4A00F|nr:high-potential iron-sulfur protein [Herbaspirillum sp. RTI4]MDY7577826.1 high-potential iron-sulfur protein [Herbaspirillum sp. RTI4]MEA9982444.1 high-potential iron-sulfur protein [Herbaspirillum sp. RTI4]
MLTRRSFLNALPASVLALGIARNATAQAAKLAETDPTAVALGYKADATKVDIKKAPAYVSGRVCSGCQLYQGKAGEATGPCGAFGGKLVSAKGWCVAWVKKA